jgi:chloramphenicol 3-O phosphotransferase
VGADVIVLNGGSSSGKSSLAACLQPRLGGTWLTLGIDDLIRGLSHGRRDTGAGGTLEITSDGSVVVGDGFGVAELAWYEGLAAIARAGTGVIIDEVFLGGGASQARLQPALKGLSVIWVGVRCEAAVAEAREMRRSDRTIGMARDQAERVHLGVHYDVVVDTSDATSGECAAAIVTFIGDHHVPSIGSGGSDRLPGQGAITTWLVDVKTRQAASSAFWSRRRSSA